MPPSYVPSDAENITDHGISQDYNPDDPSLSDADDVWQAFVDAATASGDGGAVYIPAGTYFVSDRINIGNDTPGGISIYGDGPGDEGETKDGCSGTCFAKTEHLANSNVTDHVMFDYEDNTHGTVTMQEIRFDGNASNPNFDPDDPWPRFAQLDKGGTGSLVMENVYVHDIHGATIRPGAFDVDMDRCTFEDCGIQNRKEGGTGGHILADSNSSITVTADFCKFWRCGAIIFNVSSGADVTVRDCWAQAIGVGLAKLDAIDSLTVRRYYHEGHTTWLDDAMPDHSDPKDEYKGRVFVYKNFDNEPNPPTTTDLKDVEARDFTLDAFTSDENWEFIADQTAIHNSHIDLDDGGGWDDRNGNGLTFNVGEVSVHDCGQPVFYAKVSDGSIDTLHRANNSGGLGNPGDISIAADDSNGDPLSPDVPAESDIGINSSGSTDSTPSSTRDPEVFTTDFTATSLDSFTPKWASTTDDWTISSTESKFGDAVLELSPGSAERHALSWDDVGTATDVEVLALVRVPADSDSHSDWCRSYVRGADTETAYLSALNDSAGFVATKYVDGSASRLGSSTVPNVDVWYWTRLRVEGDTVELKHWSYGDSEPDSWDIQTTDSDITSDGWVGIGGYPSDTQQFDYLGVGVGGASPSVPTASDEPSLFDDWTSRWASSQSDWSAISMSSNDDDAVLELAADSAGRHGLSWDSVGTATDVDILGLVRIPSNDDSSSSWCRLVGRGDGSSGSETGYFTAFRDSFSFELAKYESGDATLLAAESINSPVDKWLYVRFNIEGDRLRARYWPYSESEPTSWNLDVTDASISDAGWVGAGGWSTDAQQWDYVSVGTGGASAPFADSDSAPSVSWVTPTDGETVSGTVTVQIDASDSEDGDDSLTVDYRIDGGTWTSATYNTDTGYYEDAWDTTTVGDGDHTLEAVATDSGGNTSTATITVTTDNAAAPTVDSLSASEVETSDSDAEFDVSWDVSDTDGDLSSVDLSLTDDTDNESEDSTSISVSGSSASGTTRLVAVGDDGSSNSYTVELTVTDSSGATASDTASISETEETTNSAPSINRFSVSEANRPDPHAEITVVWDVSDPDGNLAALEIDVADSSGTVQSVTWSLSGSTASDTDSFKIKDGDGKTFDVKLTVTDTAGESTSQTKSVTA